MRRTAQFTGMFTIAVCVLALAACTRATTVPTLTPAPTETPAKGLSGPEELSVVGMWPFGPSWAVEVTMIGKQPYAFLGSGGGVYILDVSQASTPRLVSDTIRTPGIVVGLHVAENILYVAALESGLFVYDVSHPAEPVLLSTIQAEGWLWDVVVRGRYAYVIDESHTGSLRVLDASDPANLREVGRYQHSWRAFHVAVQGDHAYLEGEALVTVDISDPTDPREVYRFQPYGRPAIGDDGRLYLAAGYRSGIQVLDINREGIPTLLGAYDTLGEAEAIAVRDGYAYVADGGMGLTVYAVSDPSSIHEVGAVQTGGHAMDVSLLGDHAYVADYDGGLRIVSVADPERPWELAHFAVPSDSLDIAVRWPYAFVATRLTGVKVLDLSDPTMSHEVATIDTPGEAHAVLLDEGLLYLADWGTGVSVMDVSDPMFPHEVASIPTVGDAKALQLDRDRLYVTGYIRHKNDAITIIDVSDPRNPRQVGQYTPPGEFPDGGNIRDMVANQGRIYMLIGSSVDGCSSLLVVDVTDAASPNLLGSDRRVRREPTYWDELESLAISGDYAYIGAHPSGGGLYVPTPVPVTRGILVLDVSDPQVITEVGRLESLMPTRVEAVGSRLYAATSHEIAFVDISDSIHPRLMETWGETTSISSVHIEGSYAFLARGKTHLQAISGGRLWGSGVVILGEALP